MRLPYLRTFSKFQNVAKKISVTILTPGRRQSKTPTLSRNVDQKSIETVFSIAICRHTGDKWQSKTLFLSIFDPRSSIVDNVFYYRLPGVILIEERGSNISSLRLLRENASENVVC